jgi:hypothetical protein
MLLTLVSLATKFVLNISNIRHVWAWCYSQCNISEYILINN